eukprot:3248984-Rhodomonas_salina.1
MESSCQPDAAECGFERFAQTKQRHVLVLAMPHQVDTQRQSFLRLANSRYKKPPSSSDGSLHFQIPRFDSAASVLRGKARTVIHES